MWQLNIWVYLKLLAASAVPFDPSDKNQILSLCGSLFTGLSLFLHKRNVIFNKKMFVRLRKMPWTLTHTHTHTLCSDYVLTESNFALKCDTFSAAEGLQCPTRATTKVLLNRILHSILCLRPKTNCKINIYYYEVINGKWHVLRVQIKQFDLLWDNNYIKNGWFHGK